MSGWRVSQPTARPLPPKVDGLLEEGADALPVRITIVQDDVETGWDDGALGFEEESVWFSGRACSFQIGAHDVRPGTYACSGVEAVTDGEALQQGFPLRHPKRDVWVRVKVLVTEDRKEWEDEARLIREVKRLRALSGSLSPPGGSAEGGDDKAVTTKSLGAASQVERVGVRGREAEPSQYPPLAPRPGMLRANLFGISNRQKVWLSGIGCLLFWLSHILSAVLHVRYLPLILMLPGIVLMFATSSLPNVEKLRQIAEEEAGA